VGEASPLFPIPYSLPQGNEIDKSRRMPIMILCEIITDYEEKIILAA
jgi:hypothetical protein